MGCCDRNNRIVRGCITLSARLVSGIVAVVASLFGGIAVRAAVVNDGVAVTAERKGGLSIDMTCRNERLTINASLVCGVNLAGDWEYLQVTEGNVILIDNRYVLVLRKKS